MDPVRRFGSDVSTETNLQWTSRSGYDWEIDIIVLGVVVAVRRTGEWPYFRGTSYPKTDTTRAYVKVTVLDYPNPGVVQKELIYP